jgi:hypothetical protein
MATTVTGTFAATGNSAALVSSGIAIDMTFAGAATVNVQWQLDGTNWTTVETFTASDKKVYEGPRTAYRLNCSAHTANVTYVMRAKEGERADIIPAA